MTKRASREFAVTSLQFAVSNLRSFAPSVSSSLAPSPLGVLGDLGGLPFRSSLLPSDL
jgi:hypothetical protein